MSATNERDIERLAEYLEGNFPEELDRTRGNVIDATISLLRQLKLRNTIGSDDQAKDVIGKPYPSGRDTGWRSKST